MARRTLVARGISWGKYRILMFLPTCSSCTAKKSCPKTTGVWVWHTAKNGEDGERFVSRLAPNARVRIRVQYQGLCMNTTYARKYCSFQTLETSVLLRDLMNDCNGYKKHFERSVLFNTIIPSSHQCPSKICDFVNILDRLR